MIVNMLEAKTRLSQLVALAEHGEPIVIARAGRPAAMLVRYVSQPRKLGLLKGQFNMKASFHEDTLEAEFYGTENASPPA